MQVSQQAYEQFSPTHASFPTSPLPEAPIQNGTQTQIPTGEATTTLPKVGQTRCYWALLSSELDFIYMDPVLSYHLGEQAESLIGKSVLAFVHPDELSSAKQDLGGVIDSKAQHGSVTRVRYSRLSKVRQILGHDGPPVVWEGAEKVVLDDSYMAVDIVINWAADGLVLCFIHAVVDLDPADNDEDKKTHWTNWCGTPIMTDEQINTLYQRLLVCLPHSTMGRVFQILSNQSDRTLLLTWPPDDALRPGVSGKEFAKLVEDVQIGSGPSGSEAKTSCTRRYKAEQKLSNGMGRVESIFVPHGSIIFACHKVDEVPASAQPPNTLHLGYSNGVYPGQANQQYYPQSYSIPAIPSPSSYSYSPSAQSPYPPHHWQQTDGQLQYHQWGTQAQGQGFAAVSDLRSGSSYPSNTWPSGPIYPDSPGGMQQGLHRAVPSYSYPDATTTLSQSDMVPPPRRRISPAGSGRDGYSSGGRSPGNRPVGVLRCTSCKATNSPEWRKGPSGKKELCNACGLRYARSRAKKEGTGTNSPRRRKEKLLSKSGSATPPISSNLRRSYDEGSIGSASGSDIYPSHPNLDGLTPSPSPPAAQVNFVHYNHAHHPGDLRHTFYSVPSPLSNSPTLHAIDQQFPSHVSSPIAPSPVTTTRTPASFERGGEDDRELSSPVGTRR